MSLEPESREEAIARLNRSASDLKARTTRHPSAEAAGHAAASQAWKIVADLLGGVFVGLALGWAVDHFAGTSPVGIIGGVLLGFAISVVMAWRTAHRLMVVGKHGGGLDTVLVQDYSTWAWH